MPREPNRFHDNLIMGYGDLDSSRPLDWNDPVHSPRVYGRPTNIRQIVSWWGRLKAAWLVFTLNAVAVRWYDEKNADQYGRCWHEFVREWARERVRSQSLTDAPQQAAVGSIFAGQVSGDKRALRAGN